MNLDPNPFHPKFKTEWDSRPNPYQSKNCFYPYRFKILIVFVSNPSVLIRPGDLIRPQGPDLSCGVIIRLAGPVFVPWIPGSSCQAVTCLAGPDSSCRAMSRGP